MPKVSLYREAWLAFKRNFSDLWPWILGFSVLVTICNFYITHSQLQMAASLLTQLHDHAGEAQIESLVRGYKPPPVVHIASLCGNLIEFIGVFYFSALYLQREPLTAQARRPEVDLTSFLGWFWQMLKVAAALLAMGLAVALLGLAASYVARSAAPDTVELISGAASVGAMLAIIYGVVRFFPVGPLALGGYDASFKTGWLMTKGHWWRLGWGYLCLGGTVFVAFALLFIAVLVAVITLTGAGIGSVLFSATVSVLTALFDVASLALTSVYICVAARVLIEEQGLPRLRESV